MKRLTICLGLLAAVSLSACNGMGSKGGGANNAGNNGGNNGGSASTPSSSGALETEDQKTLYALGLAMAKNTAVFNLSPSDAEFVKRGFTDAVTGAKPEVELEQYGPKIQALAQTRMKAKAEGEKQKGQQTLDAAAGEPGAQKLPSGMVIKTITPGNGPSPQATDTVKVNYEGKLADGKVFDSSYKRNAPATFPLRGVVPCWTEGLQHMKVGEKAQLTCPSNLAYGDMGHGPDIPGGATLIFTVELLEIVPQQQPGMGMPGMPGQPGQPMPGLPGPGTTGGQPGHAGPSMPGHPGPSMPGHPAPGQPGHPAPGTAPTHGAPGQPGHTNPPPPPGKGGAPVHH